MSAIIDIQAAGEKAAKGRLQASPFYWHQNDRARSFANRFVAATGRMPDAPHAAAYVAVRHPRAVVVTEGLDADRINQGMRRNPAYFFGRPARPRIGGRLPADLSLPRVRPASAMRSDRDNYDVIGTIPVADTYHPPSQTGCDPVL